MNEFIFKSRLALGHFLSHAGIVILCLVLLVIHRISFPEAIPILTVVAPVLAIYAPDIISFVHDARYQTRGRGPRLGSSFTSFSIAVFLVSHGLIYGTVLVYVFTGVMTPSQFQTAFGTIEVFFALYMGTLMRSLYGRVPERPLEQ